MRRAATDKAGAKVGVQRGTTFQAWAQKQLVTQQGNNNSALVCIRHRRQCLDGGVQPAQDQRQTEQNCKGKDQQSSRRKLTHITVAVGFDKSTLMSIEYVDR